MGLHRGMLRLDPVLCVQQLSVTRQLRRRSSYRAASWKQNRFLWPADARNQSRKIILSVFPDPGWEQGEWAHTG